MRRCHLWKSSATASTTLARWSALCEAAVCCNGGAGSRGEVPPGTNGCVHAMFCHRRGKRASAPSLCSALFLSPLSPKALTQLLL